MALTSPGVWAVSTRSKDLVRHAPEPVAFQVQTMVKGLSHPWSLAWLPGGDMLISKQDGHLRRVSREFQLDPRPIEGLPVDIVVDGQGGLFDVAVHPATTPAMAGFTWRMRRRSKTVHAAHRLVDLQTLFAMWPASRGGRHFGGRIVFDRQGHVFLTLGDRGDEACAQKPRDHAGSVIR
jgi:glucose/arabinose dehydrogenase